MNIFMQGMRRSGTTILFDILSQDENFDLYYEPFAAGKVGALGGGSGVQTVDLFEKIRGMRDEFCRDNPDVEMSMLNYGAPGDVDLEFTAEMPSYCKDYIRFLVSRGQDTVIKFTRMYCKVPVLKSIDPHAKFVHIVRDPRAVTASYLFGRNKNKRFRYFFRFMFFRRRTGRNTWKLRDFSERIMERPEYSHLQDCEDYIRALILWKFTFSETYQAGKEAFGDNYYLIRHDDLLAAPEATIRSLYGFLGLDLPPETLRWAAEHVKTKKIYAATSRQWRKAVDRLDLAKQLKQAGYLESVMGKPHASE